MLVKELRQELAKRGLNTSGKKADLEKRYKEALEKEAEVQADLVADKPDEDDVPQEDTEDANQDEAPKEPDDDAEMEDAKPEPEDKTAEEPETTSKTAESEAEAKADPTAADDDDDDDDNDNADAAAGSSDEKKGAKEEPEAASSKDDNNDSTSNGQKDTNTPEKDEDKEGSSRRDKEDKFRPLSTGRSRDDGRRSDARLYVGNLSFDVRDEELREEFAKFGEVVDVFVPMDRYSNRKSRGFAFVTFESSKGAEAAIDGLNNKECLGRRLQVNIARPRPKERRRHDSYSRRRRSRSPPRHRDRGRRYSRRSRSRSPRRDRY